MPLFDPAFWTGQPIDMIMFQLLIWFGWIPIAITLVWGFIQMWLKYRSDLYDEKIQRHMVILSIDVPSMTEQTPKAIENLFANLYGARSAISWKEKWIDGKCQPKFSFEIVSTEGYIQFYVHLQSRFRDVVEAGIYAQYPEAEITEVEDYTRFAPDVFPNEGYDFWGSEFVLKEPSYFPIRTYVDFEDRMTQEIKDPLGQILEQMGKMRPGEHFWIQFLCEPAHNSWKEEGLKFINDTSGVKEDKKKSALETVIGGVLFLPNAVLNEATGINLMPTEEEQKEAVWEPFMQLTEIQKQHVEAVFRKVSKVGFNVKTRLVYLAKKDVYNKSARTALIKGMLYQYSHLNMNSFDLSSSATPKDDYFWQRWFYEKKQRKLMYCFKDRSFRRGDIPSLLNTEELASLWHFPAVGVKAPLVQKILSRRAEPPVELPVTYKDEPLPTYEALPGLDEVVEISEEQPEPAAEAESSFAESEGDRPEVEELTEALPKPKRPTKAPDVGQKGSAPPNLPI